MSAPRPATKCHRASSRLHNQFFEMCRFNPRPACENRLLDVNDAANVRVASYAYDYLGRRISRTIYGTPNVTIRYAYDGDRIIAEYDGSGTLLRKFIYGPGLDEPICLIDVGNGNAIYYYHFDGLGSVVALSDVNKVILERYAYDVFGRPTIRDPNGVVLAASAWGNPYLFTGRAYDSESGLHYYRARYYDHATGRFLQPDPLGYAAGLNLYAYCANDPLNRIDPLGLIDLVGDWTRVPSSPFRSPNQGEQAQIDKVITDLSNAENPVMKQIGQSLGTRTYVVDTSMPPRPAGHAEYTRGQVQKYTHPNNIYFNPSIFSQGSSHISGRLINGELAETMMHEDLHLRMTYRMTGSLFLDDFLTGLFGFNDGVDRFHEKSQQSVGMKYVGDLLDRYYNPGYRKKEPRTGKGKDPNR